MKKRPETSTDDGMHAEYDFSGGVRGKYAERYAKGARAFVKHADGTETAVVLCEPGQPPDNKVLQSSMEVIYAYR